MSAGETPIAWVNGRFVPVDQAMISIFDLGLHGVAVTEMLRTFAHRPYRLDAHLDRLERSREALGFAEEPSRDDLSAVIGELIERNSPLVPAESDLGFNVVITGGLTPLAPESLAQTASLPHSSLVTTFSLPFERWASMYESGQSLVISTVRQVPPASVDPAIKSRNRLHWFLADRDARLRDLQSAALVLDGDGNVAETAAGNIFAVVRGEVWTPKPGWILEGISREVVRELCGKCGIGWVETDLTPAALAGAGEVFTSSSLYCLLPVTRLDGKPIGSGRPGPVFQRLIEAWNTEAGLDIILQARRSAEQARRG